MSNSLDNKVFYWFVFFFEVVFILKLTWEQISGSESGLNPLAIVNFFESLSLILFKNMSNNVNFTKKHNLQRPKEIIKFSTDSVFWRI